MSKIVMYAHGGSGNHGCEAIVRASCKIFDKFNLKERVLISSNKEEDMKYGISKYVKLIKEKNIIQKKSVKFLKAYFELKVMRNYKALDSLEYIDALNIEEKNDVVVSIGGDNYCYKDVERYIMLHNLHRQKCKKTILWGCSIEPDLMKNPAVVEDLKAYSLVTARESITYEALLAAGIKENVKLFPDPAFQLDKIEKPFPEGMNAKNIVGINLSPMVIGCERKEGVIFKNYRLLIQYILNNTNMTILLIPHVIWNDNDDRKPLKQLYDLFSDTKRVFILEDHNCLELKGYISRCRFFIGARTHSTIAAYSTCVPTVVVGYSVKARGIAKDIFGTDENYVISAQSLNRDECLTEAFQWLVNSEEGIRTHLEQIMPEYCRQAVEAGREICELS